MSGEETKTDEQMDTQKPTDADHSNDEVSDAELDQVAGGKCI